MSTHNICFYGEITKIIPKLSPNIPVIICNAVFYGGRSSPWVPIFFKILIMLLLTQQYYATARASWMSVKDGLSQFLGT